MVTSNRVDLWDGIKAAYGGRVLFRNAVPHPARAILGNRSAAFLLAFCEDAIIKSSSDAQFAMIYTVTAATEHTSLTWWYRCLRDEEIPGFKDELLSRISLQLSLKARNCCPWICRPNYTRAPGAPLLQTVSGCANRACAPVQHCPWQCCTGAAWRTGSPLRFSFTQSIQ